MARITEIKIRQAAATPGPWYMPLHGNTIMNGTAADALEKQIPKEIDGVKKGNYGYKTGYCPNCGVIVPNNRKHCHKCGQALKCSD